MAQKISQGNVSGSSGIESTLETKVQSAAPVWIIALAGIVVGLCVAIFWRADIADDAIGFTVASTLLGTSAQKVQAIGNSWFALAFAIAAGLGTTFTACNCVVFSCIAPLSNERGRANSGVVRLLLWMSLGVVVVTGIYGIVGAILDRQVPGLSQAVLSIGSGVPVRLLQSSLVFVSLGVLLIYWGLASLEIVKNPLRRWIQQRPWVVPLSLGVIVGFFTVGRPYPLFRTLFQYSAGTRSPLLSALLVALQGECNIVLMALIFVLLTYGTRGRFERWMQANPLRARALTALSVIGGGTFLIAYWGVRAFARYGIGWFPHF